MWLWPPLEKGPIRPGSSCIPGVRPHLPQLGVARRVGFQGGIAALASILTTVDHAIAGYDLWSRPETVSPSDRKPPEQT